MDREEFEKLKKLSAEQDVSAEQVKRLRSQAERMTTMLDGLPHGNGLRSNLESSVMKLVMKAEELQRREEEILELKLKLALELTALEPIPAYVMSLRYLEGKSYREIAGKLGCSVSNVFRMHRQSLKKILRG